MWNLLKQSLAPWHKCTLHFEHAVEHSRPHSSSLHRWRLVALILSWSFAPSNRREKFGLFSVCARTFATICCCGGGSCCFCSKLFLLKMDRVNVESSVFASLPPSISSTSAWIIFGSTSLFAWSHKRFFFHMLTLFKTMGKTTYIWYIYSARTLSENSLRFPRYIMLIRNIRRFRLNSCSLATFATRLTSSPLKASSLLTNVSLFGRKNIWVLPIINALESQPIARRTCLQKSSEGLGL